MLLMASPIVVPTIVLTNTAHDEFKQAIRLAMPPERRDDPECSAHAFTAAAQLLWQEQAYQAFVPANTHNEPSF